MYYIHLEGVPMQCVLVWLWHIVRSLTSIEKILLRDRPQTLYDLSSKGTVPVLQLADGSVIDESVDIMKWALKRNDPEHWYKENFDHQDGLVNKNDEIFKKRLDRYKYHVRFPERSYQDHRADVSEILNEYNSLLEPGPYMFGKDICFTDIALMPFVRQCAHVDLEWFNSSFPELGAWLDRLKESELFISIMVKYPIWNESESGQYVTWE
ncbi:glutathione S-transferase [bacterium]|nr:MAG: glutathione S-transferase [bacterium]